MTENRPDSAPTSTKTRAPSQEEDAREGARSNDDQTHQEAIGSGPGGARTGLHGKLVSARSRAPEGASEDLIQAVAFRAYIDDRPVDDVFEELEEASE